MRTDLRTLNIRLNEDAYKALQALSIARGISMNKVVEEGILEAAESARRARLKEAFARIAATSAEEQSVDFGFEAQSGVVLGSE